MFRTHKNLSIGSKISSLYVFDALARAARDAIDKKKVIADPTSTTGNCATFLLKLEGILDSFVQDLLATKSPELKVSILILLLGDITSSLSDRHPKPPLVYYIDCSMTGNIQPGFGHLLCFPAPRICDCNRLDVLKVANNEPFANGCVKSRTSEEIA